MKSWQDQELLSLLLSRFVMIVQLDQRLADRDWRWHLERSYTLLMANGHVELFFIDTSPFVEDYQTAVWSVNEGRLCQIALQEEESEAA